MNFSKYPEQLGGEYLMNFDIKDSKGSVVLSSEEALKKYIDTGNTVKGVTRVFPISMNGTFYIEYAYQYKNHYFRLQNK